MILEYSGLQFHGISILQNIPLEDLEDLIYNFAVGQGCPPQKNMLNLGYST
jgi:hypothetical protein